MIISILIQKKACWTRLLAIAGVCLAQLNPISAQASEGGFHFNLMTSLQQEHYDPSTEPTFNALAPKAEVRLTYEPSRLGYFIELDQSFNSLRRSATNEFRILRLDGGLAFRFWGESSDVGFRSYLIAGAVYYAFSEDAYVYGPKNLNLIYGGIDIEFNLSATREFRLLATYGVAGPRSTEVTAELRFYPFDRMVLGRLFIPINYADLHLVIPEDSYELKLRQMSVGLGLNL